MALKKSDIAAVKGKGFLLNRGTGNFSGRIVAPGTVFYAKNFNDMAELAEKFGNGKLICTSRQSVEIPGIAFENIPAAIEFAQSRGLRFGGTGAKVRPVTACKGTTCVYGNCDTQALAKSIYDRFYLGWQDVSLPHKFKIAVGGCPNSCIKPSLNDLGIQAHKVPVFDSELCRKCGVCAAAAGCPSHSASFAGGELNFGIGCTLCGVCAEKCPFGAVKTPAGTLYRIFVGGTWGKKTRPGTPLSFMVGEDELFPILEKLLLWYRENGYAGERLGAAVDRLGEDVLEAALLSDDLSRRKDEILAGEIKTR